jgi:ABC-type bacteriocin/lantibiotic exporter with double-glycine peptidase domain
MLGTQLLSLPLLSVEEDNLNEDQYCGVYSLFVAMVGVDEERAPALNVLIESLHPNKSGNSLADLEQSAVTAGFNTLAVHTTLDGLIARQRPFACIAHLPRGHFLVLKDVDDDFVRVVDPPHSLTIPRPVFESEWDGNCLLVAASPLQSEALISRELSRHELFITAIWTVSSVVLILAAAVLIRIIQKRFQKRG